MVETGRIVPASLDLQRRFVRSLPESASRGRTASVWERIGWNDATAVAIYRDNFRGSGPLAGTTPASRGGVGDAPWTAPDQGWQLTPEGLAVTGNGACAWLPFTPQPGMLYRLTVEMQATSGASWLAGGVAAVPRLDLHFAQLSRDRFWFLQRSEPGTNEVFVNARKETVDATFGPVTRSVVLDMREPAKANFFLSNRLLRSELLDSRPSLTAVVLSTMGKGTGTIRGMSLEQSRPAVAAAKSGPSAGLR